MTNNQAAGKELTDLVAAWDALGASLEQRPRLTLAATMEVLGISDSATAQQATLQLLRRLTPLAICRAVQMAVDRDQEEDDGS